jgi:hypothetical protein
MNKYLLADMVTEKLEKEIGMVAKPLPGEIKILEGEVPSGRLRFESALYQTEKLKKITISKHDHGESGAGALIMIIGNDEYDLPSILADIAYNFVEKGKMFVEFEVMPLVKDDKSTKEYVAPFLKWYDAIDKLPSEPVTGFPLGEYLKANLPPIKYMRFISDEYTNEVLNFAQQFFDIFLDIYPKVEPIKDVERRRKMETFRLEYNKHALEDDPSGLVLIEAFGRPTAELFFNYLVYL